MNQTMYEQNVYFPDVFKGCLHACVYCKPSFQRQAKRQLHNCKRCYAFEPHSHLERLKSPSPKTTGDKFVFFPKGGDIAFCPAADFLEMLKYARANPQTTFLIQTKDPRYLFNFRFPNNVILDITLETTDSTYDSPSIYKNYPQISIAPLPLLRAMFFAQVDHKRKGLTIEPILKHDLEEMVKIVKMIKPEFVYVGYDTKGCHLPEPTLKETLALMNALSNEGFVVRAKTLRKAWYEGQTALNANLPIVEEKKQ